jgi:hypothetical protein
MKKLVYLFSSLFILTAISCKNDDDKWSHQQGCFISVPCEDPAGLITVAQADIMEENYKSIFYSRINESMSGAYPGYEGAGRYIWFDLEEVKKYIVYVEENATANGYQGKLGLRVYMGAKEQNNASTGAPEPRQTVFFVPTSNPTAGPDLDDNINITSMQRLNLGGAGIPDGMDQETGH